ncbi:hypothetical protein GYA49_04130 [Candidatus Beckwithbacteria bacterium]|nr:hypothetical protein [Candidatus Beckwithbacteria bacterium]
MAQKDSGVSEDMKTLVTILLLIFVFPIGFIVMWAWPRWKTWVKLLVSLPTILIFLFALFIFLAVVAAPSTQIKRAECTKNCATYSEVQKPACITECMSE